MTDYVYVDTETTGLTDNDELLSVSVVNDQGECLYHSLLKPEHTESWEAAETVNAITPEMVADAPSYNAVKEQLGNIFEGKHVVAYNMAFDGRFLEEPLKKAASTHCAMLAYAEYNGEWDQERDCFKWKKLADAVQNLAPDFKFKAHDSLEDTKALKVVWDGLKNNKAIMNKYGAINEVEAVVDSKQSNAENKYLDFMVDTFVTAIGNGTAPWEKDWTTGDMANLRPFNPETGSIYSGRNAILLSAVSMNAGYKDNRWVTFNQAKKAGGQVKKGQHGVPCSV